MFFYFHKVVEIDGFLLFFVVFCCLGWFSEQKNGATSSVFLLNVNYFIQVVAG